MQNIYIPQGTSLKVVFPVPAGVDITGFKAQFAVRPIFSTDPFTIILKDTDRCVADAIAGTVTAELIPADTQGAHVDRYLYDVFIKNPANGETTRLEHGYFFIDPATVLSIS